MKKTPLQKVMSELGKLSYKKSPRTKEQYSAMGKKSGLARRKKVIPTSKLAVGSLDVIIETEQD